MPMMLAKLKVILGRKCTESRAGICDAVNAVSRMFSYALTC